MNLILLQVQFKAYSKINVIDEGVKYDVLCAIHHEINGSVPQNLLFSSQELSSIFKVWR